MKTRSTVLLASASMFVILVSTGCRKESEPVDTASGSRANPIDLNASVSESPDADLLGPAETYFPMQVGNRWEYTVTLGKVEAFSYEAVLWSEGRADPIMQIRYRPLIVQKKKWKPGKTYRLTICTKRVISPIEAYELDIEKDELGIFPKGSNVVWVIDRMGRYKVLQSITFAPDSPGAPLTLYGTRMPENGGSMRPIFFKAIWATKLQRKEIPDAIMYMGGQNGLMWFSRTITAPGKLVQHIMGRSRGDAGFREDTWFGQGKGLVKLVQTVNDVESMRWKLVKFTPG